jgi:hypothetical protein
MEVTQETLNNAIKAIDKDKCLSNMDKATYKAALRLLWLIYGFIDKYKDKEKE